MLIAEGVAGPEKGGGSGAAAVASGAVNGKFPEDTCFIYPYFPSPHTSRFSLAIGPDGRSGQRDRALGLPGQAGTDSSDLPPGAGEVRAGLQRVHHSRHEPAT